MNTDEVEDFRDTSQPAKGVNPVDSSRGKFIQEGTQMNAYMRCVLDEMIFMIIVSQRRYLQSAKVRKSRDC